MMSRDGPLHVVWFLVDKSNVAWFLRVDIHFEWSILWEIEFSILVYGDKTWWLFHFALSSCGATKIICDKVIAAVWFRSMAWVIIHAKLETVAYTGKACIVVVFWISMAVHQHWGSVENLARCVESYTILLNNGHAYTCTFLHLREGNL